MTKLNSKKLKSAYELISGFHTENRNMIFDVPSLLQYCMEKDLRDTLKLKKFTDPEIDRIIKTTNFKTVPRKKGTNKVEFQFSYNDYSSFIQKCNCNL